MASMVCPKCGFQQEKDPECRRCGIIVARYRGGQSAPGRFEPYQSLAPEKDLPAPGMFRRCYRVSRWAVPAMLLLILGLALHASPPPAVETSTGAARQAEAKLQKFEASMRRGLDDTLVMDQSELNGWLGANLAIQREHVEEQGAPTRTLEGAVALAKKVTALKAGDLPTQEQVQSSVRDVRIELRDDSLLAYTEFELFGMRLSLVLEGKLVVRRGYLRLEPTRGRLGSLPLLAGTLQSATARLFDSPENKEKFRLPPYIHDVRIEFGQLVISSD
jgi:hypothetical protein